MIRLIATDLDGTLLEKGGALPEGFYDVAEELKKARHSAGGGQWAAV